MYSTAHRAAAGLAAPSILGNTGIGMSVRGEQFWLDPTRAAQLRPRSRPRYTLTPSIVLRNGQPFMALGTPGGDNQDQTILQAFLNVVEFWNDWYPNVHEAFEWPRVPDASLLWLVLAAHCRLQQAQHRSVRFPMRSSRNCRLAATMSRKIRANSISSCATAVIIDPATNNRIAGADPRRDCYAMAY